jgi:hypothetical protein
LGSAAEQYPERGDRRGGEREGERETATADGYMRAAAGAGRVSRDGAEDPEAAAPLRPAPGEPVMATVPVPPAAAEQLAQEQVPHPAALPGLALPEPAGRLTNLLPAPGAVAEWLRSGLQSRAHRFDSGRRLSRNPRMARRWAGSS